MTLCSQRDFGTDYASVSSGSPFPWPALPGTTSSLPPHASLQIPPHSRWRHFTTPTTPSLLDPFLASWQADPAVSPLEIAKRLLDLFVVSVLLDAGAGDVWAFQAKDGSRVARSEGLAVGSLEMFETGGFSGVEGQKLQVNSQYLALLHLLIGKKS